MINRSIGKMPIGHKAMSLKKAFILLVIPFATLVGCGDNNPTNAPTDAELKNADVKRAAAIDADKSMTPQQREEMKKRLGLSGGASGQDQKR